MEDIKKKREGFTNKSTTSGNKIAQKRSNQKQQTQKGSNNLVWGHFVAQTVHMIVYFWIFFPFWSYQLQIIIDQANCGPPPDDRFGVPAQPKYGCSLPWQQRDGQTPTPYAPALNAQAHVKPVHIIKQIEVEMKKIYHFIVWCIKTLIHALGSLFRKGTILAVDMVGVDTGVAEIPGGMSAMRKAAMNIVDKDLLGNDSQDPAAAAPAAKGAAAAAINKIASTVGGGSGQKGGAQSSTPKITAQDVASTTGWLDSKLAQQFRRGIPPSKKAKQAWASKLAETVGKAACCKDLKQQQWRSKGAGKRAHVPQLADCDKPAFKSPFSWLFDMKKFGWPYNYIFDSKAVEIFMETGGDEGNPPKAYNPELEAVYGVELDPSGDYVHSIKSWKSWIMAWFAQTQLKAWSRSRWLMHTFLYLFYPFLFRPLTEKMVHTHFDNMIYDIEGMLQKVDKVLDPKQGDVGAQKKQKYNNIRTGLEKYKNILRLTNLSFRKKCHHNCDIKSVLFETLQGYMQQEGAAIKAYQQTLKGKEKNNKLPTNFFVEFYIATLKPLSLRQYKGSSVWWKWCEPALFSSDGAGFFYWGRYLITLCMPHLMSIQLFGSFFMSILQTVVALFNRYSIFWLPIFFYIVPLMINMFVMPAETLYYLLIGPSGSRNNSAACPYTGGMYQMRENIHTYWPLNLFICVGSIITHLGATLLSTKTGPPALGKFLSGVFPVLIVVRILVGFVRWLISLFKSK